MKQTIKKAGLFQLSIMAVALVMAAACRNGRRPGLSDRELFALQQVDTLQQPKQETDFLDMETYVVPPGIKYVESRAVDPANPPVVFDIASGITSIKTFDLSDYYSQVRYIRIKHPNPAKEGAFLFDARLYMTMEHGSASMSFNSTFDVMNDSIVAGDVFFGFHSYDYEGNFLNTVSAYDFPKVYDASQNKISCSQSDYFNALEKAFGSYNNRFRVDDETVARYVYNRRDTLTEDFLFTFNLHGDTLCRFRNYNPKPEKRGQPISPPAARLYYNAGIFTVQQAMNDTVYRMTAPNRLVPAFVVNYGAHKLDIALADDFSDKFFADIWRETDRYVLFTYSRNYDSPNNRNKKLVTFFYAYYDKQSRQFYHMCEETSLYKQEFLMDNTVPDALPFILTYANIQEKSLQVIYSKKRLGDIIKNNGFASLPSEQQNKLKTLQSDLADNEVLIMLLQ